MSCCGGQRIGTTQPARRDSLNGRARPTVAFVYSGRSSLTVVGGATGRAYRFAHPGCGLELDARDAPGAASIPTLRRVP
jgi:hypothetical protein